MTSISVLWQLPQFTLLMVGELLLAIPGIQFAYKQAPRSMKSVVTAAWFINNAFGNLIVVLITELKPFNKEVCTHIKHWCCKHTIKITLHCLLSVFGIFPVRSVNDGRNPVVHPLRKDVSKAAGAWRGGVDGGEVINKFIQPKKKSSSSCTSSFKSVQCTALHTMLMPNSARRVCGRSFLAISWNIINSGLSDLV